MSVSVPFASDPAGMLMVALPLLRVIAPDEYVPLVNVTEPVGVGVPLTVTVTVVPCAVVILAGEGVTVTVGAVAAEVTVTVFEPVADEYVAELRCV